MGVKQSIIDWLESVPGPTEAQARRWRHVRWGLLGVAVLAVILMWYVLYRMDANDPPCWLKVPAEWLLEHVPAAQGHTNLAFALRDQMPYMFTVGFFFSVIVALFFLIFNNNRVVLYAASGLLKMSFGKFVFALVFGEFAMVLLVYIQLYGFSSGVSLSGDKTYMANIDEIPGALMIVWVPIHGLLGVILGQHLVVVRDLCFGLLRVRRL